MFECGNYCLAVATRKSHPSVGTSTRFLRTELHTTNQYVEFFTLDSQVHDHPLLEQTAFRVAFHVITAPVGIFRRTKY